MASMLILPVEKTAPVLAGTSLKGCLGIEPQQDDAPQFLAFLEEGSATQEMPETEELSLEEKQEEEDLYTVEEEQENPLEALFVFLEPKALETDKTPQAFSSPKESEQQKSSVSLTQKIPKEAQALQETKEIADVQGLIQVKKGTTPGKQTSQLEAISGLRTRELQALQQEGTQEQQSALNMQALPKSLTLPEETKGKKDAFLNFETHLQETLPENQGVASIGGAPLGTASPEALPEAVSSKALVPQILQNFPHEILRTEGEHAFKIQLHPRALGEVQIHVILTAQGHLQAAFSGAASTMDLLRQDSELLLESLKKEGFNLDSGNFSFTSDQQTQQQFKQGLFSSPPIGLEINALKSTQANVVSEASLQQHVLETSGAGLNVNIKI